MYTKRVLLILINFLCSIKMEYQNFSVYKVTAFNENERLTLYNFYLKDEEIIFLNGVTNDASIPMNVIIWNESYVGEFEKKLKNNDIEYYNIESSNLKNDYKERVNDNKKVYAYTDATNISNIFFTFNGLVDWSQAMCRKYTVLHQIHIGRTHQKRDIFLLKLSSVSDEKKPAVVILGGEQGRDWMSAAIIINLIQKLMDTEPSLDILSKLFDIYFLPVLNPDGYSYSMEMNELWNKNRQKFIPRKMCKNNKRAVGVNIDRNFYFARTSSSDECDSVHFGRHAISEEESLSIASFLNSIAFDMMAFINLRDFDNLVTTPFSATDVISYNHAIVAEIMDFAIKKANRKYKINIKLDPTFKCFYNFSGNIPDWVKRKFNTPIVLTAYITNEHKYFTSADDIVPLTNQFASIVKDILLLTNRIYRPLFNKQVTLACNHIWFLFSYILLNIVLYHH